METEIVEAVETPAENKAGLVIIGAAAVAVGVGVTLLVRKFMKQRAETAEIENALWQETTTVEAAQTN